MKKQYTSNQCSFVPTQAEPNFKHTGKTFCTGKLIKNLNLPVQNEKIIYWQPVCFFLGDLKIPFKSPQSEAPKRERQGDWRRKRGWRGQTLTCVCAVPCIGWTEQLRCREHFAGAPCNIRVLQGLDANCRPST